jgi:hypothetical protein
MSAFVEPLRVTLNLLNIIATIAIMRDIYGSGIRVEFGLEIGGRP